MGSTPVYAWPYPDKNTTPAGHTQVRDLALATEADVNRIETTAIAGIESRLAAVEAIAAATRWRHISSGTRGAGDFVLTVPAGFDQLRLQLSGDVDATGFVFLRINGNMSNIHQYGFWGIDADAVTGDAELVDSAFNINEIKIVEWGTIESNMCTVDIMPTDGAHNPAVMSTGIRLSEDPNVNRRMFGWGKLVQDAVVSSLTIIDQTNFVTVRWWLEGRLA